MSQPKTNAESDEAAAEFRHRMKLRRDETQITQPVLAGRIGFTSGMVSKLESGKVGLTYETAVTWARGLGLDVRVFDPADVARQQSERRQLGDFLDVWERLGEYERGQLVGYAQGLAVGRSTEG